MKITFIGTGYVGLVSGVIMSHLGHFVTCLDQDNNKIKLLKDKETPIFEPGLKEYISKYGNTERLNFTNNYDEPIRDSDCVFITVGTPALDSGDADLTGIFSAAKEVCKYIKDDCLIVVKSTVPPGTCKLIQDNIFAEGYKNIVVSNPEFLREGSAIDDFLEPDRIVIGSEHDKAFEVMRKVYKPITDSGAQIVETDLITSELIKYASNTFLANKIAFINEMADLCEIVGADITTLSKAVGLDKRIGESFLNAGPGFGGSCFPKDILALQKLSQKMGSDFLILDAIIKANDNRPNNLIKKIIAALGGSVEGKKLAILGLTYKAKTDDLRSSPAIELINQLTNKKANIIAYDPEGMTNASKYFARLKCANSMMEAIDGADGIIIVTEWEEFKQLDLKEAKSLANNAIIIDLRNILDSKAVLSSGFKYYSIGKKNGK